ncbi:MAG: CDP-alcohol phosphatidyltransferase family protein [Candidatus Staskawiczbacteria bacterium]|jgi:phosphatidylglycerophosphate synthase
MIGDFHYFSSNEVKYQERLRLMRDKLLRIFLKPFIWLHISPNLVTFASFASLAGFFYFFIKNPIFAIIFLLLHVLLDGIDGSLARATGKSSRAGGFLDMLNDHTGMVVAVAAVMYYSMLNPVIGLIYVYIYSLLVVFIIYQNSLGIKSNTVFRTKYLFYALYILWALTGANIFNGAVAVFIVIMLLPLVFCILKIYSALKNL